MSSQPSDLPLYRLAHWTKTKEWKLFYLAEYYGRIFNFLKEDAYIWRVGGGSQINICKDA
jgi:hypothetical protein